jgi:lysophospholipase L1-like esterase
MKRLLFFVFCLLSFELAIAQAQPPFWNEIIAFKKADTAAFPQKNAILFVGSSSFRMWQDVQKDFPGLTIINRGFGGSSLPDLIRYENEIIFPYAPKQIVIYAGENDLAGSDTLAAQTVVKRFVQLFNDIRSKLPDVPIAFVSIKPSPSRAHLMPKMVVANTLIAAFLKTQPHTAFVDVYRKMLTPEGKPMPDIFLQDNLHMNRKGYEIWRREISTVLKK